MPLVVLALVFKRLQIPFGSHDELDTVVALADALRGAQVMRGWSRSSHRCGRGTDVERECEESDTDAKKP